MVGPPNNAGPSHTLLWPALISTAVSLALITLALVIFWGPGPILAVLPWYVPMMHGFAALAALNVAFLAFGRHHVLREPGSFWIGMAFGSFVILALFYILSWPGLLPGERALIAELPNTAAWFFCLKSSALAIFLLAAVLVRWPRAGTGGERWWFWLMLAALGGIAWIGWLSLVFERLLPLLVVGGAATSLFHNWLLVLYVAFAADMALSVRRYRHTGDSLFGRLALAALVMVFAMFTGLMDRRYDLWWYLYRVLMVGSFSVMLFGLLSEYVDLFRREQEKTRESRALYDQAQRRAAELQGVLNNMVDGVYVCDARGRITLANRAGLRLVGLDRVEQVQRGLAEFAELLQPRRMDGRPVAPQELPLARALAGEVIVQEDEIIGPPGADRDTCIRTSAAPLRDERGRIVGAVAVSRDVTVLMELDRLKDQFISVAAHELKTPVAIMKGYAQVLLRPSEGASERQRRMLEAINRGADRIDRIVKDLLGSSQMYVGRLELTREPVELPSLAAEVADRMARTTGQHRIRLLRADPAVVQADRARIEHVLINLVDNAIKYAPAGGDIDLAVSVAAGEVVVSVRDRGIGIPAEKQARIFQPFYRAHDRTPYDYSGMGIGLYISKEIVTHHGGRMWFESEVGQGSTFSFSLPLSDGCSENVLD